MKNRSVISIVIFMFVILGLFTACADSTPGNGTGEDEITITSEGEISVPGGSLAQKLQWLETNAENGKSYLLEVSADREILASQFLGYGGKNISIRLRGNSADRVIEFSTSGALTIGDGITLVLDNNILLRKNYDNVIHSNIVEVGGALILDKGAKIGKGRVYVSYGGTFTMNGGEISNNLAGGGVCVLRRNLHHERRDNLWQLRRRGVFG